MLVVCVLGYVREKEVLVGMYLVSIVNVTSANTLWPMKPNENYLIDACLRVDAAESNSIMVTQLQGGPLNATLSKSPRGSWAPWATSINTPIRLPNSIDHWRKLVWLRER